MGNSFPFSGAPADGKTILVGGKIILAGEKIIFAGGKIILAGGKIILAGGKIILTGGKIINNGMILFLFEPPPPFGLLVNVGKLFWQVEK